MRQNTKKATTDRFFRYKDVVGTKQSNKFC